MKTVTATTTMFVLSSMAAACDAFTVMPQQDSTKSTIHLPYFAKVVQEKKPTNVSIPTPAPAPVPPTSDTENMSSTTSAVQRQSLLESDDAVVSGAMTTTLSSNKRVTQSKPNSGTKSTRQNQHAHPAEGIFAPLVRLAKRILGEQRLNQVRAKAIGLHSDVIGRFVSTADTKFGETVLRQLFELADRDGNGTVEQDELARALHVLGFDFLKEKQIAGIFRRADADGNGGIDYDEWKQEAPKTLRTNLIKLAKKNGGDLGFLV